MNEAPEATNLSQEKTVIEGGSEVALDDIVVTDGDAGDTITVTLTLSDPGAGTLSTGTYGAATSTYNAGTGVWMVQGLVADVNAALAAVALTPSAGNDQDFTIDTWVRDAAGTGPAGGTISITVTPVNDAPVVTTSGGSTAATEGSSVVVDGDMTLSDPDNITMASATVSIAGNFLRSEDVLAFTNDGLTMGNISAIYNEETGVLTLTSADATATQAQWQAALRAVTYENTSQNPATANRTISFVVNDGTDDSVAATKTVTVTAVNDAPTITAPATIPATAGATTPVTGISFSDADSGSAAVSVTLSVPSGTLSAASGDGVAVGGTSSDLTLTGSIASINAFVDASKVSYTADIGEPVDVDLTVIINDGGNNGAGGTLQDTTTVSLSVAAAAPVVTDGNVSISGATGTGGVFKIGDTVTAEWDNSAAGDNNSGVSDVTIDFSQFGGGAAVVATNSGDVWTATYMITPGSIDATNLNISVTATNDDGNATTISDTSNATADAVVPLVASVAVPANGTYVKDDTLTFDVVLDDVVDITGGSPRLAIDLNTGGRVYANYVSGSGTNTLTFDLVVAAGQVDKDGIEIVGLDANGATITDAVGNVADLTLQNVADTSRVLFDAPAPGGGGGGTQPSPGEPFLVGGTSGNDLFEPITGTGTYQGEGGHDTIVYAGGRDNFTVNLQADGSVVVSGSGYSHTLNSFERLQFDDGTLAFDTNSNAGQVFRLYQAVFGREPDPEGLGYWIQHQDAGQSSFPDVARSFMASPEFEQRYGSEGSLSNSDFLDLLYQNVLGRDPDEDGFAYWIGKLDTGQTNHGDLLAFFSDSKENVVGTADAVSDGIWFA